MSCVWLTLCVFLSPLLVALLVFLLICLPILVCCPMPLSEKWKQRMSQGAMGLQGDPKKSIPHGILDLATLPTYEAYCASLERGSRRTMQQSHASMGKHGIVHSSKPSARAISLEHLQVAIAHEKRVYSNRMRAALAGLGRFVGAKLMTGVLDEYRGPRGELLAWSQSAAKGSTLRGMWYYARLEVDKMHIWFFNVRLQVIRGQAKGLRYIDAGPSPNDSVKILKQRYGFTTISNWRELQGYEGEWQCLFAVHNDSNEATLLNNSLNPCSLDAGESTDSTNNTREHSSSSSFSNNNNDENGGNNNEAKLSSTTTTTTTSLASVKSIGGMPPRRRSKKAYNRLQDSPILVAQNE